MLKLTLRSVGYSGHISHRTVSLYLESIGDSKLQPNEIVERAEASDEELTFILENFMNLPRTNHSTQVWREPWAAFIGDNLVGC